MLAIEERIAVEIQAKKEQVAAAVTLLDEGSTVPFIARYRKEATGGLNDTQLRLLQERLLYLRELEARRATILDVIREQGKLSVTLEKDILAADNKARLEDLYLPYKPKRRTKAQIAREAGLQPLAEALLYDPTLAPEHASSMYISAEKGVADVKAALDGARAILMEQFSENPELVGELREWLWKTGRIHARVQDAKKEEGRKYSDYFDHIEAISRIPSHRLLALFRARNENILDIELEPYISEAATLPTTPSTLSHNPADSAVTAGHDYAIARIAHHFNIAQRQRPADAWLWDTCRLTWKSKLHLHLTLDLFSKTREKAEEEAICVFGDNLKDLLLAAPAGPQVVMGLDPGLRTGVKIAVVDATGKVLGTGTIYPHAPKNQWDLSLDQLHRICTEFKVQLIAIGNGTASRETERLVSALIKKYPELHLAQIVVSEAGASVYSASELAAKEFPNLDVSLRGAVSIARRLQDPLAELVKIDPKAIGVGQYQHDVNQIKLARALDARVEDCVNAVGVDVNTASAPLLSHVAGLTASVAENVVKYRDTHGAFRSRAELYKIPRLGDKIFVQAAGFLRIPNGENPLDASAVHPEAYPIVMQMAQQCGHMVGDFIGDSALLKKLNPHDFISEQFGLPTIQDILKELEKPGRDPRPVFVTPKFSEGIESLADLKEGMVLEGRVTNVAAFGAFVDIGVHQDGLVHVSALANQFVKDPRSVVKTGTIVQVKVMEIDLARKRIALSMRLDDALPSSIAPQENSHKKIEDKPTLTKATQHNKRTDNSKLPPQKPAVNSAFAEAFARAKMR